MDDLDQAQQLRIISTVLRHHPGAAAALATVKAVISKSPFPINSLHDFAAALGGDGTAVPFDGRMLQLTDLQRLVPAYYFPIVNENDLIAKVSDLMRRPLSAPGDGGPAKLDNNLLLEANAAEPADSAGPPQTDRTEIDKLASQRTANLTGRLGGTRDATESAA